MVYGQEVVYLETGQVEKRQQVTHVKVIAGRETTGIQYIRVVYRGGNTAVNIR
jgi:hypothetical protein